MAFISNNEIILENGQKILFDDIFPVKILYPCALMSNATVYNLVRKQFVKTRDNLNVSNVCDIFSGYINGNSQHIGSRKIGVVIKLSNDNIYSLDGSKNIVSGGCFPYKNVSEINCLVFDNVIKKDTYIYTHTNNTIYVKNGNNTTIIDNNCIHIQTNVVANTNYNLLEICLIKNNNIKIYHYWIDTCIVTLKQKFVTGINIHKSIRNYLIDIDGFFYRINIVSYANFAITKIETKYKFYDVIMADYCCSSFLLQCFDQTIIKYYICSGTFHSLEMSGSFCLSNNKTKSVRS